MFGYKIQKEGLVLSAFLFLLVLVFFHWQKKPLKKRAFLFAFFAAYLGLLWATVSLPIFRLQIPLSWSEVRQTFILEPLSPLVKSFKIGLLYLAEGNPGPLSLFIYNSLGNLLLLMPLALFNRLIFKCSSNLNLFICCCVSFLIETWQAFLNKLTGIHYRVVDINDLILNTVGAAFLILIIALVDRVLYLKKRQLHKLNRQQGRGKAPGKRLTLD